jgi:hypothetical protein
VSEQVVNSQPKTALDADVPLQMVEGITPAAYPNAPQGPSQPGFAPTKAQAGGTQVAFSGGGTPEPERLLGLLLLAMTLVGIGLRLRRRTAPG